MLFNLNTVASGGGGDQTILGCRVRTYEGVQVEQGGSFSLQLDANEVPLYAIATLHVSSDDNPRGGGASSDEEPGSIVLSYYTASAEPIVVGQIFDGEYVDAYAQSVVDLAVFTTTT